MNTNISIASKRLNDKHYAECVDIRKLDSQWIKSNCYSADIKESSELLHYTAKSECMVLQGFNGQYQLKPDKPWKNENDKKAAKYRTAAGDNYDVILPRHPENLHYWTDLNALKEACYQIDGKPYLLITEGLFKAIASCSEGYPCIAVLGVEMGLTPKDKDPQGKRYLVPTLEIYAKAGFNFILSFDADINTNNNVKNALKKLGYQLKKFDCDVQVLPAWDVSLGKGIDDYIVNNGIEDFRQKLLHQCQSFESWLDENKDENKDDNDTKNGERAFKTAKEIAEDYRDKLVFCEQFNAWFQYEKLSKGLWSIVPDKYVQKIIQPTCESLGKKLYSKGYLIECFELLKLELYLEHWIERKDLLPFKDCVVEINTGKVLPHSPGYRFTWQLPRNYQLSIESNDSFENINNWLDFATNNNKKHKDLLLCFLAAILRQRYDLQKFLHLIGIGGSGKSTYCNLATELIGKENVVNLNFDDLSDKNYRVELINKRLLILPDQENIPKSSISVFKGILGQDSIRGHKKFKDSIEFKFEGMVLITSNNPIFSGMGTQQFLVRRQNTVTFNQFVDSKQAKNLMGEFEGELASFTRFLLSIPSQKIDEVIKNLNSDNNITLEFWRNRMIEDSLAGWVNDNCYFDDNSEVLVGNLKSNEDNFLYSNYSKYCDETGRTGKLALQKFSGLLTELAQSLGYQLTKVKTMYGAKIQGIGLRIENDTHETIEDLLERKTYTHDEHDGGYDDHYDEDHDDLKQPITKPYDDYDEVLANLDQDKNFSHLPHEEEKITDSRIDKSSSWSSYPNDSNTSGSSYTSSYTSSEVRHGRHNDESEISNTYTQETLETDNNNEVSYNPKNFKIGDWYKCTKLNTVTNTNHRKAFKVTSVTKHSVWVQVVRSHKLKPIDQPTNLEPETNLDFRFTEVEKMTNSEKIELGIGDKTPTPKTPEWNLNKVKTNLENSYDIDNGDILDPFDANKIQE